MPLSLPAPSMTPTIAMMVQILIKHQKSRRLTKPAKMLRPKTKMLRMFHQLSARPTKTQ